MSILLSTNMYSTKTFPRIQRYLDFFQGAVGVEVFPLFHDRDFDAELNRRRKAQRSVSGHVRCFKRRSAQLKS